MPGLGLAALIIAAIIVFLLLQAVKIIPEYERGVVFRLGKLVPRDFGPGITIIIPVIDSLRAIDDSPVARLTRTFARAYSGVSR